MVGGMSQPDLFTLLDRGFVVLLGVVATVVAVEATITVAQADTKVVSLSGGYGHGQSIEERAATLIQSYYKGYLATFNPN
ncbi:hypothetical protein T459_30119 [Capsicum annuum]|uniref:Uncharacterized protein n=1 Tax=Capsicum annuum TaxID=4072 RepID=A0A2G2Y7I7_CAPAN|nr:hypothetical protein T459_30119 [Capsicum annuum]